jgi:hypothetical protein
LSDADSTQEEGLRAEINESLAAVWKRFATVRPRGSETEIDGNIVRCRMKDSVGDFEQGMNAEAEAGEDGHGRTTTTYRREASAAVAKTTRQRVMAFISDHDAETGLATEVFVLESAPRRTVRPPDHRIPR